MWQMMIEFGGCARLDICASHDFPGKPAQDFDLLLYTHDHIIIAYRPVAQFGPLALKSLGLSLNLLLDSQHQDATA